VSRNQFVDQPLGAWQSIDIGHTGSAAQPLAEHDVIVSALGDGIKLREDQFRFIHVPATGDFELTARIDCMDDPGTLGQAGLMVRDTLDGFSAHAYFALATDRFASTGIRKLKGTYRRETDPARLSSNITIPAAQADVTALPIYLKLKRTGTRIAFEHSPDGVAYTEVGGRDIGTGTTQVNLRDDTLVGLAITGGGTGPLGVTFREVSGKPFTGVAEDCATVGDEDQDGKADCADEDCAALPICLKKRLQRGDADQNDLLQLTDAVQILSYLFLGSPTRVEECFDVADADDNGLVQLTDAVRILGYLFLGNAPPAPPGPPPGSCGPDPTDDDGLTCNSYTPCP